MAASAVAARTEAEAGNRKADMLHAAARLFAKHGFDGTSMRMIADLAKVRSASLYYHFPSKTEMLVAVYQQSAEEMVERVQTAIRGETDPWKRLELACCAHMKALLAGFEFIQVVFVESPRRYKTEIRNRLVAERDRYEAVFRELVDALPIRRGAHPKYLLLTLLGSMAWSRTWYRPGGDPPETIAREMLAIVRNGVAPTAGARATSIARG